ncbi:26S proteasome regulatory subunit T5 [Nematocida parisii]|uniref:26S proteasome regulatory subunit 6A n=1 Tax=Nematocida parisii (strain ERTm3) TaxID=935791 RepID=I3EI84_NEMP3|nr:26s proteasome regulatory subunit 6A [Nematocida parisii ERTm1]EIJ88931.1 26s proteasome regulatory subunit 6A [Nematocida parisii ERTm3]KAI5126305.1 26S proteasome regulatory subunit T5 [Nematocida parisii]EIJ93515.1 26s proteasome regulatory subunit 6A [Nematocida parisii ERTm1]KAI5127172.1 26S proteasome regulatory subunit T5 [Nematocida parisii]KAI5140110.1 26S proteasome regulatory subunit T5 [Nematocida parisii]|eukprot:XP_013059685.1 26s proteasome regulatory subunit 6A [Nematocida parisii ERTm1]
MSEEESLRTLQETHPEIFTESVEGIKSKTRMIENEIRMLKSHLTAVTYDFEAKREKIQENMQKIELNKQLPFLVGNVVEVLDLDTEKKEVEEGSNVDKTISKQGLCAVVKTSNRVTSFLPFVGLVPAEELKPGDLVALHKETNIVFEKLDDDFDIRVKAMELDEKPTDSYEDIGGLERQMEELYEGVILSITHPEKFKKLNIVPPKGILMYGPPGTGKTLMARACAAKTGATFLKLAGPQLVQMYIGDGAKLVRDAFALARAKAPAIIFIDEIDAIGTKRSDSDSTGDREVQRTMLELLNQLDGFSGTPNIKVIAATNRIDILDPALLRSGRFDRKIEFPLPNKEGRKRILQIHSRKMAMDPNVNHEELARSTEGFNGAQCKAVCVEAGMIALRAGRNMITQNDLIDGVQEILSTKKASLHYFS